MDNHVKTVYAVQMNIYIALVSLAICVYKIPQPKTNALTMESSVVSFKTHVADPRKHLIL